MFILLFLALTATKLAAGKARLSHSVITADLDGDGRKDKASVFTNQVSGISVVTLELATGRSLPLYAVPARVGAKLSLEIRFGGDARCPDWTPHTDQGCGYTFDLSRGPSLVVHEPGKRNLIFAWTGGRPAEFILERGFDPTDVRHRSRR
jgi:hypothetical protein